MEDPDCTAIVVFPQGELPPGTGNEHDDDVDSEQPDDMDLEQPEQEQTQARESPQDPEDPVPKLVPEPVPEPTIPPDSRGTRTKVVLIAALAVLLAVIALVCGLVLSNPEPDPDPGTTAPPATTTTTETTTAVTSATTTAVSSVTPSSPPTPYSVTLTKIVNRTVGYTSATTSYTETVTASIGETKSFVYPLIYNASAFGMFQYVGGFGNFEYVAIEGPESASLGDFDMLETWNTTIVSVEGQNVVVNATVSNALRTREFADTLGAEQACNRDWLYSGSLGSPATVVPSEFLQCSWGTAGTWSYQPSSSVVSKENITSFTTEALTTTFTTAAISAAAATSVAEATAAIATTSVATSTTWSQQHIMLTGVVEETPIAVIPTTSAVTVTTPSLSSLLYNLSMALMANKSVGHDLLTGGYSDTVITSIGETRKFYHSMKYNPSVFGMFQTEDIPDFDMIMWWLTTIVSVDGLDVVVNVTVQEALQSPELAEELGAEQICRKEWLYSLPLGSTLTVFSPDILQCDWGAAGLWSYQPGTTVEEMTTLTTAAMSTTDATSTTKTTTAIAATTAMSTTAATSEAEATSAIATTSTPSPPLPTTAATSVDETTNVIASTSTPSPPLPTTAATSVDETSNVIASASTSSPPSLVHTTAATSAAETTTSISTADITTVIATTSTPPPPLSTTTGAPATSAVIATTSTPPPPLSTTTGAPATSVAITTRAAPSAAHTSTVIATTSTPTPHSQFYNLSMILMVNKSVGNIFADYVTTSQMYSKTMSRRIGETTRIYAPMKYNSSVFGMFQPGGDMDDFDMIMWWENTIVSIEGHNVSENVTVLNALQSPEFAKELGAKQICKKEWLYSLPLGSPTAVFSSDILRCNWGAAGLWSYQSGSSVMYLEEMATLTTAAITSTAATSAAETSTVIASTAAKTTTVATSAAETTTVIATTAAKTTTVAMSATLLTTTTDSTTTETRTTKTKTTTPEATTPETTTAAAASASTAPPPSVLYNVSLAEMVNRSWNSDFSSESYTETVDLSIGETRGFIWALKYNNSAFGLFQYTDEIEALDMIEWWNTTIVSIEGHTVTMNTTVFNALRTQELVVELGAPEQFCMQGWLYSLTLGSLTTVFPPYYLQCNWGNAGIWSYQPGSSVMPTGGLPTEMTTSATKATKTMTAVTSAAATTLPALPVLYNHTLLQVVDPLGVFQETNITTIGETNEFIYFLDYNATESTFLYDSDENFDLYEYWTTVILSVEGMNVTVNTTVLVAFLDYVLAEAIGAEPMCEKSWTYSLTTGEELSRPGDPLYCNWGRVGTWSYETGSSVSLA